MVGFGSTEEQAAADHDENLMGFLERCNERCLQLNNASKIRLRLPKLPFIGHVATAQGLQVDPHKVQAVREMPTPEDVAAVQRLLGFVQYLSKFMPHLSDVTKPLRELTQNKTVWNWRPTQQEAFETMSQKHRC